MKVVINQCWGGFSLSDKALQLLADLKNEPLDIIKKYYLYNLDDSVRADPLLIQVVEELGKGANGLCSDLVIVTIPDGLEFRIIEVDDGIEDIVYGTTLFRGHDAFLTQLG